MASQSRALRRHGPHVAVEDRNAPGSCARCQVPLDAANEAHVQADDPRLAELAEQQREHLRRIGDDP
jgi:hypothetical protein